MKKTFSILITITILFVYGCGNRSNKNGKASQEDLSGTISISGVSALFPLVQKWAVEFQKVYPNVRISVSASSDSKGITDALSGKTKIGMLSRELSKEESDNSMWIITVAKNAVVPIVNLNNPVLQQIMLKGLKKDILKDIFITGKVNNWDILNGKKKTDEKINVYRHSDACGEADTWAKYLSGNKAAFIGTLESDDADLTQAIRNDNKGIGFTSIAYAYDQKSGYENSGIKVLPIDFNGNGVIDDKEFFYQHKDSLAKAIADGRFSKLLVSDLYLVCKAKPSDNAEITFLKWILTDGQKFVSAAGFIHLSDSKAKAELNKIE